MNNDCKCCIRCDTLENFYFLIRNQIWNPLQSWWQHVHYRTKAGNTTQMMGNMNWMILVSLKFKDIMHSSHFRLCTTWCDMFYIEKKFFHFSPGYHRIFLIIHNIVTFCFHSLQISVFTSKNKSKYLSFKKRLVEVKRTMSLYSI